MYMKEVIFLIISSTDHSIYNLMKNIIDLYCEKMKLLYSLKHFFVEFKEDMDENNNILLEKNNLFIKGKESLIPGILIKTKKALNYINANYTFDYIIRTNLSSFWNIPHLFNLFDSFENNNLATGVIIFNHFITGTGIILSKDISLELEKINENILIPDDVAISDYLQQITQLKRINESEMYYLITKYSKIPDDISNILYFRIKTDGDREYDGILFKQLAEKIYNIII